MLNFKKGSIFSRSAGNEDDYEEYKQEDQGGVLLQVQGDKLPPGAVDPVPDKGVPDGAVLFGPDLDRRHGNGPPLWYGMDRLYHGAGGKGNVQKIMLKYMK